MSSLHFSLPTLEATEHLATLLAPLLRVGDVVTLQGDLGTGKTTFARSLLHGLGIIGEIPSPTFTLMQSYLVDQKTYFHLDLYRLKDGAEREELGWGDMRYEGVSLIEWPERADAYLPSDRLNLHFKLDDLEMRTCFLEPCQSWRTRLQGVL